MRYQDGFIIGTGAARNVPVGFIPSMVRVLNITDGDAIYDGALYDVIAFDSGGGDAEDPREIKAGDEIHAADDSWAGTVHQVLLASGSWADGNATGFIVLAPGSAFAPGEIANNDAIHVRPQQGAKGTVNQADATGPRINTSLTTAAAVGAGAANTMVTPWNGGPLGAGFTIGSAISEDNKLFFFQAWAPDPVAGPVDMSRG